MKQQFTTVVRKLAASNPEMKQWCFFHTTKSSRMGVGEFVRVQDQFFWKVIFNQANIGHRSNKVTPSQRTAQGPNCTQVKIRLLSPPAVRNNDPKQRAPPPPTKALFCHYFESSIFWLTVRSRPLLCGDPTPAPRELRWDAIQQSGFAAF